jgi:hypothetical protein
LESGGNKTPGGGVPGREERCRKKEKSGGKSANGAIYTRLGHRPGKADRFIPTRAESPFYSAVLPLFIIRAFSPYEIKGHLSWGDAALAPGWYKIAPLALNCDFRFIFCMPGSHPKNRTKGRRKTNEASESG